MENKNKGLVCYIIYIILYYTTLYKINNGEIKNK